MLAFSVGTGFRNCGIAGEGIGRLSRNGVVAGLGGTGVGGHKTGSVTVVCAYTVDFLDVNMVGSKIVAAPAAPPIFNISLLVISDCFFSLSFFSSALFLGIRISFQPSIREVVLETLKLFLMLSFILTCFDYRQADQATASTDTNLFSRQII
jgi:hypothetical protein